MGRSEVWITDFRSLVNGRSDIEIAPYRTNGRKGYMPSWKGHDSAVAVLPTGVKGWHEIHLGFFGDSGVRLRVSGDPWFDWVESTARWDRGPGDGEEAFWKIADLTDAGFEFLPFPQPWPWSTYRSRIAYLRLVPISDAEASRRISAMRVRPTRTAGAVIDGHEALGQFCPQSPDEVRGMIAPFIDSDFKRLHWACVVTPRRVHYVTKVGHYAGQGQNLDTFLREGTRRAARSLLAADRQGYDPLEVMIEFAAANGLELWPSFRIQQDYHPDTPIGKDCNSPFADAHPEWRQVDRHGQVCGHRFSHFHEGWEQYKLDLLAELAGKGPPGIHLNLMCEVGAIWDFAPHAVERFKKQYGLDPCADDDPPMEWYQFRCDHLTAFMRRFRKQTDEVGRQLGKRIRIAVQVSVEREILRDKPQGARAVPANLIHGFDIRTWAKEGLVDVIAPSFRRYHQAVILDHIYEELGEYRRRIELAPSLGQHHNGVFPRGYDWNAYFTDAGKDRTDLLPTVEVDPWRILREANDVYQQGADGVDVWEMGDCPQRLARWNVLKHIGDRAMLAEKFGTQIASLAGRNEHSVHFETEVS